MNKFKEKIKSGLVQTELHNNVVAKLCNCTFVVFERIGF